MKSWKLWQFAILTLLALVALCSQFLPDLLAQKGQEELLEISVLLREPESTTWSNTRQGMEQSALDWGVELRFLTLADSNDSQSQASLLTRELEGGADGIILAPCDVEALAEVVSQASGSVPFVTLESPMGDQGAVACIAPDQAVLGTVLAQSALNGLPLDATVLLIDSAPNSQGISQRLSAAQEAFLQAGITPIVYTPQDQLDLSLYLSAAIATHQPQVVLAFEPQISELLASICTQLDRAPLLYGTGSTLLIAAYLEQGGLTAIAVQNEYATGYLAVETAVQAIRGQTVPEVGPLEVSLIRRETMYDPEHERLLFPVT